MISNDLSRRRLLLALGATTFGGGLIMPGQRAWAQGTDAPVKLLLGSHMEYLQALAPAYAAAYGPTPEVELVTTGTRACAKPPGWTPRHRRIGIRWLGRGTS